LPGGKISQPFHHRARYGTKENAGREEVLQTRQSREHRQAGEDDEAVEGNHSSEGHTAFPTEESEGAGAEDHEAGGRGSPG
jgi:hypothetical protein